MYKIDLEEYKSYLVNKYRYEYDNNENQRQKRLLLLNNNYSDEYLESIITGTYIFASKIIELAENNYYGYIEVSLEREPEIKYIDLNLIGGWKSDTIVSDSRNNFYSINLLKKIFGEFFSIEPCKITFDVEVETIGEITILSKIPSYYLYIQCKKGIIDNVKKKILKSK